jgi:hypothetical protein
MECLTFMTWDVASKWQEKVLQAKFKEEIYVGIYLFIYLFIKRNQFEVALPDIQTWIVKCYDNFPSLTSYDPTHKHELLW